MPVAPRANTVHVAVGVIVNQQGEILISRRHIDSHQGGLWEFPGGKVEAGESLQQALSRELNEEVGISVGAIEPLLRVEHDYGDKQVLLDVWLSDEFTGIAEGREGQTVRWVVPAALADYSFPAANMSIIEAVLARLA